MKVSPVSQKSPWPADAVERRPVASLVPYARNSRVHSDAQISAVAASIREFGFTVPVLVDPEGTIIAGHARVLASQKLGLDTVPVMVAKGWSDAQRQAYVIADNQIATQSSWNKDMLRIELADLQSAGFELELTGFAPAQLADFIGGKDIEPPYMFDGPAATSRADRSADMAEEGNSSAIEIDPDAYEMGCKCPRCGFEFDPK